MSHLLICHESPIHCVTYLLADTFGDTDVIGEVSGEPLIPVDGRTDGDGRTDTVGIGVVEGALGRTDVEIVADGDFDVPVLLVHPASAAMITIITVIVAISFFI